jgi:hypothetical protein
MSPRGIFMSLRFIVCRLTSWALLGFIAGVPAFVHAQALGVGLNSNADCATADLDLTLTTEGATRESGLATNLAGATLNTFEKATTLGNFSGTFTGYVIGPLSPPQPPETLIGSYAYVGTTPPTSATTVEFFIYYNCSTRKVLLSCYGPYGTCPQTAQQAAQRDLAAFAAAYPIPTLDKASLALTIMLLGISALLALRRHG